MCTRYDVCVIGAGIMGSATARHLAKLGQNTLLLEKFPLPHWRGSSHGQTRVCRSSYLEPYFMKMAEDAKEIWIEIEKEAGEKLLHQNVGMLTVEEPPSTHIREEIELFKRHSIQHEVLPPQQLKLKFPELDFAGYSGVTEKTAGILMADKCLKHMQMQFIKYGGTLRDGQLVSSILPDNDGVTIKTSESTFRAKKVIITAGPWTNKLLEPLGLKLPLQVYKAPVFYWKITKPNAYTFKDGFPCFYDSSESGLCIYFIPSLEYPGLVKLGPTGESQINFPLKLDNPDDRDIDHSDLDRFLTSTSLYLKDHFPYLDHRAPVIKEMCLYTMTPESNFIIDRHPRYDNIIVGAGFSAHGFKHAPVVGKILSQLALDQTPSYDISHFKIPKFTTGKTKSSL